MPEKSEKREELIRIIGVSLKIGMALALIYLAVVYYNRWTRESVGEEREEVKLHDDLYVHPARSYVTSLESAQRRLVGNPLWVKVGWYWEYQPGGKLFKPLEEIVPTAAYEEGGETLIRFDKAGQPHRFAITRGGRYIVDDVFFIEDPRELYGHWSAEDWEMISRHDIREGMSEFQTAFALGFGSVVSKSQHSPVSVIDYKACQEGGIDPVRVTFRDGIVEKIEPLEEDADAAQNRPRASAVETASASSK